MLVDLEHLSTMLSSTSLQVDIGTYDQLRSYREIYAAAPDAAGNSTHVGC